MAESNNQTTFLDQLNSLRTILPSDDHLQIQPSGDYDQVRIKIEHDVQINFFFDPLTCFDKSLTLNNITDLRISKASNKCPLTSDEWTDVRKIFDETIQQSNNSTTLLSIIELIQGHLLSMKQNTRKMKSKSKKSSTVVANDDKSTITTRFRDANAIFNRILHDKAIDRSQVIIGFEDRFKGLMEIRFKDYKKVHEDEYGVPMHRIRHYKVNGKIVWDRTKKLDILTGNDQLIRTSDDSEQLPKREQGLYHFDHSLQEWLEYPHLSLTSDDPIVPSTKETCLPERCHFVTWNILFDYSQPKLIHTSQRYRSILHTLKSLLPDVICLQEVTISFLDLLLNEIWLKENNYYIIVTKSIINSNENKSYGQLMLMKNFRPRSFSICPLSFTNEDKATTSKKSTKELIVARFGINARVTIDLVNLHLHSDLSRNATEKRCQALENIFKTMKTQNYLLIGDFNFGDNQLKEQNLLAEYEDQIHDLWKDNYSLDEKPGYTFDPSQNICAKITSLSQTSRRLDRYLIHTLVTLSYSIELLTMIGLHTIPVDPSNDDDKQRINLSDHYGLQLIMNFRTNSISHRSALVILPTLDKMPLIDSYRQQYDPSFNRWPPHINLLWPFFDVNDCEDDQQTILEPLRLLLSQHEPFSIQINQIDTFVENNITYMKASEQSTNRIKQLYQTLIKLFPRCLKTTRNTYNPHMTIAQFDNEENFKQAKSSLILNESFEFSVQYLYILQRPHDNDLAPFHISYQIPIGSILSPIGSTQLHCVDVRLQEFFHTMNLYESNESYHRKEEKFNRLSSCFKEMFNKDTLHCFMHSFLPYGSFRMGIHGQDLDTVFVLNELKSINDVTTFDKTFLQLKNDSTAFNNHIVNLLETQIQGNFKNEIIYQMKVEALFPIISILFHDQTKVEIFVQINVNNESTSQDSIHGVHDNEHLCTYVRYPPIFQHLLTFIRTWAQHMNLYGQVFGYLGGYSWAVLCAYVCRKFVSRDKFLSSIEHYSLEEFFSLVQQFFLTFAEYDWSSEELHLYPKSYKRINISERKPLHNRGKMRIMSPNPPYNNTGRYTMRSTRDQIIQGFQNVIELLDKINTITFEDKCNGLKQILELKNDFPDKKIKSILQIKLTSETLPELHEWIGWMKSRLSYFMHSCEEKCHLTVLPQNSIEYHLSNIEACYSIGYELELQTLLNQQRNFSSSLKQFLDQFNLFPNRKNSMQISHTIISADDWILERMQPKS